MISTIYVRERLAAFHFSKGLDPFGQGLQFVLDVLVFNRCLLLSRTF